MTHSCHKIVGATTFNITTLNVTSIGITTLSINYTIMLSDFMVSVIMLSVAIKPFIISVIMLCIIVTCVIRHDRNPRFSKSLSQLEILYTRLTPVISHLLTVNTMLPTR